MQVVVRLAPGSRVAQLTRVIARLHAANAEPSELRFEGDAIAVTLSARRDLDRVCSVLARTVDVVGVQVVDSATSLRPPTRRTTYVPYIRKVS